MRVMPNKSLRPAEAYLAAIVASSDDAIIAHDLDGTITLWNAAAERLIGYTAAEAVGQPTVMLFPPGRVDEEIATLKRGWSGESVSHFGTVFLDKTGRHRDSPARLDRRVCLSSRTRSARQARAPHRCVVDDFSHSRLG